MMKPFQTKCHQIYMVNHGLEPSKHPKIGKKQEFWFKNLNFLKHNKLPFPYQVN